MAHKFINLFLNRFSIGSYFRNCGQKYDRLLYPKKIQIIKSNNKMIKLQLIPYNLSSYYHKRRHPDKVIWQSPMPSSKSPDRTPLLRGPCCLCVPTVIEVDHHRWCKKVRTVQLAMVIGGAQLMSYSIDGVPHMQDIPTSWILPFAFFLSHFFPALRAPPEI